MTRKMLTLGAVAVLAIGSTSFGAIQYVQDYESVTSADLNTNNSNFLYRPGISGSNLSVSTASPISLITDGAVGSQAAQLDINYDANASKTRSTAGWVTRFIVNLTGTATASPNPSIPTTGYIGFAFKVDPAYAHLNLQVAPVVDDPGTGDAGVLQDVIADGQWHMYQWDLTDDSQWNNFGVFEASLGNGTIDGTSVTYDSIAIVSNVNENAVLFVDSIAFNPEGTLDGLVPVIPEPATMSLLALGGLAMLRRRRP